MNPVYRGEPLTTSEFNAVQVKMNKGSLLERVEIFDFLKHHPEMYFKIKKTSLLYAAAGGAVGFVCGFVLSLLGKSEVPVKKTEKDESQKSDNEELFLHLTKATAMGVIGATTFGGSKYCYEVFSVKTSNDYLDWREKMITQGVFGKFQEVMQHSSFDDLRCPFTGEIILQPFKDQYGTTYERASIEKWLQKCEEAEQQAFAEIRRRFAYQPAAQIEERIRQRRQEMEINRHVYRRGRVDLDSLVYNMEYHPKVLRALKPFYDEFVDEEQRLGFDLYKNDVLSQRQQMCEKLIAKEVATGSLKDDEKETETAVALFKRRCNSLTLKKFG